MTKPKYNIGDIVYHVLPESPKGLVVNGTYSLLNNVWQYLILTEYHRKRNGKFELVEQALELINKYCHIGLRGLSFKELKELIDVLKKYVLP